MLVGDIRYNRETMQRIVALLCLLALLGITGCAAPAPITPQREQQTETAPAAALSAETAVESHTPVKATFTQPPPTAHSQPATDSPTPGPSPTLRPTLLPDEWKTLPVVPQVSPYVKEIYRKGLTLGNDPGAFSKVGDCGSTPAWFLGDFDRGTRYYDLGSYQSLVPVIQAFQDSFSRTSLAARAGFSASSVFASIWSDPKQCQPNETPLACEYRLNKPSLAFITLGSNDVYHMDVFEQEMRAIIEYSIDHGVIPILSTKADNVEKDSSINATIARLANEYDIPLWNYWQAVQTLPDHGLQEDRVHLTWGPNRFADPSVMKSGWAVRNLTALQTLDAVWRTATGVPSVPGG